MLNLLRIFLGLSIAAVLGGFPTGCQQEAETVPTPFGVPTLRSAAAEALPAVVRVRAASGEARDINRAAQFRSAQDFFRSLQGTSVREASGVVWTADGIVVTVAPMAQWTQELEVLLPGQTQPVLAEVKGVDRSSGVAVLSMKSQDLATIPTGSSKTLHPGDFVLAVGNETDFPGTVAHGIVSGVGRTVALERSRGYENYLQTDIRASPMMHGGALVNARGELVGLLTRQTSTDPTQDSPLLALPVESVQRIVDALLEDGSVDRGFLGVGIINSDDELAQQFGVGYEPGAFVTRILPNTVASELNMQVGDFIKEVDGEGIRDAAHLQVVIGRRTPGTEVELLVIRAGSEVQIKVKLGEWIEGIY